MWKKLPEQFLRLIIVSLLAVIGFVIIVDLITGIWALITTFISVFPETVEYVLAILWDNAWLFIILAVLFVFASSVYEVVKGKLSGKK